MITKSIKVDSEQNFILSFRHTGIVIILVIIILAGCRSKTPPVTFYTLSPMQEAALSEDQQAGKGISIGIGPVSLPDFLNKPQIVTRSGSTKINYSEFHRWGGYLDKDFLRVISENLSILLLTNHVRIHPWAGQTDPTFHVEFDVKRFDGEINGNVMLNVVWQIKNNAKKDRPIVVKRFVISEPVNSQSDNDYDALVTAKSRALEKLSREIAKELSKL
jgi:uncharacterized lipoprotein YmbA